MYYVNVLNIKGESISHFVPASTPWFEAYRNTYLDFLKQSDHEPIKHYVAGEGNTVGGDL